MNAATRRQQMAREQEVVEQMERRMMEIRRDLGHHIDNTATACCDLSCGPSYNSRFANVGMDDTYDIKREGTQWVGKYTCKFTGTEHTLRSEEKAAVDRGLTHYKHRWLASVQSLLTAGLMKSELAAPLALIEPRIAAEAQKELELELGVRVAEKRARMTLEMCLTPKQKAQFEKTQSFVVNVAGRWDESGAKLLSKHPVGRFLISKGSAFNVKHIESGEQFCAVAAEPVPVYDQMLTQKLLLEQDPAKFFAKANRSGGGMETWLAETTTGVMMVYPGSVIRA